MTTATLNLPLYIDVESNDVASGGSLALDCMRDGDKWRPQREAALLLVEGLISNGMDCSEKERAEMLFGAVQYLMSFFLKEG